METGLGSTEQGYLVMYSVARAIQAVRIIEIGTHKGGSAIAFCQAVLDNGHTPHIWTIDDWSRRPGSKGRALANISQAGFTKYIELVQGRSEDVLPSLFQRVQRVDAVLIDGGMDRGTEDFILCEPHTDCFVLKDTKPRADGGREWDWGKIEEKGWNVVNLPTRHLKGDGHLVGIAIATRRGKCDDTA